MQKLFAILATCALAACGQPARTPDVQSPGSAIPTGSFDVYGLDPEFEFIADAKASALELRMNYETVASAPYAPPHPTADGAQIVSGDLTVDLIATDCTQNGATFPLRVTITPRGQDGVTGCGIERWDTHLIALMPYINACIERSPETRWITYARRTGDSVLVRARNDDSERDCSADWGAPQSAVSQKRSESLIAPGESAAIFIRGPGTQPGGECYEAPEVRSASGELLGWMADPMGC